MQTYTKLYIIRRFEILNKRTLKKIINLLQVFPFKTDKNNFTFHVNCILSIPLHFFSKLLILSQLATLSKTSGLIFVSEIGGSLGQTEKQHLEWGKTK